MLRPIVMVSSGANALSLAVTVPARFAVNGNVLAPLTVSVSLRFSVTLTAEGGVGVWAGSSLPHAAIARVRKAKTAQDSVDRGISPAISSRRQRARTILLGVSWSSKIIGVRSSR